MALLTALSIASAAVGAYGTIRQAKASKRAAALQQQQQQVATRRSRRQAIREAQVRRAQAIAGAASLGALQSSGIQGGISSLGSQLGSELGFSTQMSGLSRGISSAQASAQQSGMFGQLGFGAFQALGGLGQLRNQFRPRTSP